MLAVTYVNAKGEDVKLNIPISWRDITWAKFVEIESTKFDNECARIAFISGIELNVLLNNPVFLIAVIDATSFIYEVDVNQYQTFIPTKLKELITEKGCDNVGSKEWGKIETTKTAIKGSGEEPYKAAATIIKTYLDVDINEKPVVEVLGLVAFFLTKLGRFSPSTSS
jgi:hypothetical protein